MRLLAFLLALSAMAPAAAQESAAIVQARGAGLIGERYDGYVGVVGAAPDALRRQVAAINITRRTLYTNLAARKSVTREDVGVIAGCTLLGRVRTGQAYLLSDNRWRRRAVGEAAPRPDYCG